MSIVAMILSFLGSIITGVLTDALKTPAVITTVDEAYSPIELVPTSADELLSQYGGLLNRN